MIPPRCLAALLVSLGLGALFFLWAFFQPSLDGGKGWITVYLGAGSTDRRILENLEKRGLAVTGESSMWVLLDNFSAVEKIPLDRWEETVEPYDPRNDGYAEQLRSFFVREGERRFFIAPGKLSAEKLKTILQEELGSGEGILWRVEFDSPGLEPLVLLLFAAASAAAALLGNLSGKGAFVPGISGAAAGGGPSFFALFCILPVLVFLCLAGPEGLVPAGILEAVFFLLREPLAERFRSAQGASRIIRHSLAGELAGWFHTFPRELLGSLAGLVLYAASCCAGNIPLELSLPVLCFLIPVLLLPPWAESRTVRNVFFPLPIRKGQFFLLFPPALPAFTLAFIIALGFSFVRGEAVDVKDSQYPVATADGGWPSLPDRAAYERHAAFQRSFSRRSLHGLTEIPAPEGSLERAVPPYPFADFSFSGGGVRLRPALSPARHAALLSLMIILSLPALWRIIRRPRALNAVSSGQRSVR